MRVFIHTTNEFFEYRNSNTFCSEENLFSYDIDTIINIFYHWGSKFLSAEPAGPRGSFRSAPYAELDCMRSYTVENSLYYFCHIILLCIILYDIFSQLLKPLHSG